MHYFSLLLSYWKPSNAEDKVQENNYRPATKLTIAVLIKISVYKCTDWSSDTINSHASRNHRQGLPETMLCVSVQFS